MQINKHSKSISHNTGRRIGPILYIAIHYVGATGDAKGNIEYYSRPSVKTSADFFVGHNGDVWQYNTDLQNRYCQAVGGNRQSSYGGTFFGKAKNSNTVSIEMCVKTRGNKTQANHPDWYFTEETVNSTVELVKYLMDLLDIPAERVIRHYDVTGKFCPGVVGWNPPSGSEEEWLKFKERVTEDDEMSYEKFKEYAKRYEQEQAQQEPSAWSADAREWAESNGIINGDANGNKQYKKPCTREELVQILYNKEGG